MADKAKANKVEEDAVVERARNMAEEVAAIRDAEQSRLKDILAEADQVLRETITIEAEVTHHSVRRTELEKRLRELKAREEDAEAAIKELEKQLAKSETKVGEMQSRSEEMRHAVADTDQAVAKLEVEQDALGKELDRLEKQKTRLDDDVKRLKKLREEYMSAIAQFKEMKDNLTG
ncbi:MAG: hypothetical protein JW909_00365 [Planctomycetes bacterium]|nr:hypothetical protein [Planctomycetota bacterium]